MFALAHAKFRENMRGPRDVQKKKKIKVSEPGDVTIEFLTKNSNYIKTLTCAKYYDELVH